MWGWITMESSGEGKLTLGRDLLELLGGGSSVLGQLFLS